MFLNIICIYNKYLFNKKLIKKFKEQNIDIYPYKEDLVINNKIVLYLKFSLSNKLETYKFAKNGKNILSSSLITSYFENVFNFNNIFINTSYIKEDKFYLLLKKNHCKTILINIPKNFNIDDAFIKILNLFNSFKNYEIKDLVFNYLTLIPNNKVSTYKDIAIYIKNKNYSRVVGNLLHTNRNQFLYPCYKVVNSKGLLSKNYAFGGIKAQKSLLLKNKIEVKNNKVNLKKYGFYI